MILNVCIEVWYLYDNLKLYENYVGMIIDIYNL